MVDPGTGIAVFGAAVGSAKLIEKLLGPTADYLGEGIKSWTQRRVENADRIFRHAISKAGDKLSSEGAVPPRVLGRVLEEGSFCDDDLSAEYFGGVLASSRTSTSRDDRGATFAALIGRLSAYQIRTHYIVYSIIKMEFRGSGFAFSMNDRHKMEMFVPASTYTAAMDFSEEEDANTHPILEHALFGLDREKLVGAFRYGQKEGLAESCSRFSYPNEVLEKMKATIDSEGILFTPSVLGAELYLWAHGAGGRPAATLLDPDLGLDAETDVTIPPGSWRVFGE